MVYAGQAGATRWPSGGRSRNTLYERLVGMHLAGSAGFSTFRLSLAAVLAASLGVRPGNEDALSAWMEEHLRVVPVPVTDADALGALEQEVLALLDPPLNLSHMRGTVIRSQLTRLRSAWKQ
ncbi:MULTISPECIES: GIY-YIG nuclease family protein [Nocardiopsis]|uniref:GIY-YIG catalytic domain-containing protein n=1 Tax=Nocardiopsis sinuspersici TaxID=501010 RepID=A0A1V3C1D8_9ACTN|nr:MULTISPECIES: hypothetical protein [Nocardiopsis]OOC54299.1 hypothetical protein NOSIN_11190 [Nocardiopsis sinuspersici]